MKKKPKIFCSKKYILESKKKSKKGVLIKWIPNVLAIPLMEKNFQRTPNHCSTEISTYPVIVIVLLHYI